MKAYDDNKKAPFDILQIHVMDSLHHLWQLPEGVCGNILLIVENGGFRSVPAVTCGHLAMKAFGRPLIHALTGFDDKFGGLVELVIVDGLLTSVIFSEVNQGDKYQRAFLTWYPLWEAEEMKRMKAQGMANRLHGEMRRSMDIAEKLDRRIGHLKPLEITFIAWAFREITGVNGYTGKVTVRYRDGGIMSTTCSPLMTPTMPPSVNRKKLAKALKAILPQRGRGECYYYLNRGLLNPK